MNTTNISKVVIEIDPELIKAINNVADAINGLNHNEYVPFETEDLNEFELDDFDE